MEEVADVLVEHMSAVADAADTRGLASLTLKLVEGVVANCAVTWWRRGRRSWSTTTACEGVAVQHKRCCSCSCFARRSPPSFLHA